MTFACEIPSTGAAAALAARFLEVVPELTTERLTLRAPRIDDFPAYADIVCTKRGRYVGGPLSREDGWYDFIQLAAGWMLRGQGGWTIWRTDDEARIGFAILGFEPDDHEPEVGYLLIEGAEGQGYATEAARAARDFAFDRLGFSTLVSYVAHGNDVSARVAERLGATRDVDAEARLDNDIRVYRHTPTETLQ